MSHHNAYPKCPRCESILPGGSQHDTESECITQMIRERKHREYAFTRAKAQVTRATERAESWKLKFYTLREVHPTPTVSANSKRLAGLEARADASEESARKLAEELGHIGQRVKFLVATVDLRRAS